MNLGAAFLVFSFVAAWVGSVRAQDDPLSHHRKSFEARFSDTAHYPIIAEYLKGSDDEPKPGEFMPQSGHAAVVYLPKEVAEIIGSTRPGPLLSYLVAYFDHPETYSIRRLRELILVSLSGAHPSAIVPWGSDDFKREDMRCFFVPIYMARILHRDFPKTDAKADWIAYFDELHLFSISQ